jgi:hypothetical protein
MWKSFTVEHREAWENAIVTWEPLEFVNFQIPSDANILSLRIAYLDPISNTRAFSRFCLISHNRKFGALKTDVT